MSKQITEPMAEMPPKRDPLDLNVDVQDVVFMQIGNLTYQALTAQKVSAAMEAKAREVLAERDAEIEHLKEELKKYEEHLHECCVGEKELE